MRQAKQAVLYMYCMSSVVHLNWLFPPTGCSPASAVAESASVCLKSTGDAGGGHNREEGIDQVSPGRPFDPNAILIAKLNRRAEEQQAPHRYRVVQDKKCNDLQSEANDGK